MKWTKWMIVGAFALGLAVTPKLTTHAAEVSDLGIVTTTDKSGTATSTAQFTATAGNLTLDRVPDMNFGETNVEDLVNGTTLNYKDSSVTQLDNAKDGQLQNQMKVTDYRGSNAGWTLSANAGAFTNDSDSSVMNVTSLSFTADGATIGTSSDANSALSTNSFSGSDTQVWGATAGNGAGVNTADVKANGATLVTAATPRATAGTYRAPITWTLSAAPSAN